MTQDADFVMEQEPTWSPWYGHALMVLAQAHLLRGEPVDAERAFARSVEAAAANGNTDLFALSSAELAMLLMDRGQWDDAADVVTAALQAVEDKRMHDYVTCLPSFAAAARLAIHRGNLEEADRQLTRAMRARPAATSALPFIAVRVRLQLARLSWVRGDYAATRHLFREIDDILLVRPHLGALVAQVEEFRDLVASRTRSGTPGAAPLTPAELRLLPYLQTHLTIAEIGERLFISRNTVSTEVASIYRKLGVSSRGSAVDQAHAIGLLGS
jgi:LuxR family maltose regulon positive regulatory protein